MIDTHPTILISNGHYFNFDEPEHSAFDIQTIAHALSHLCRFTGHTYGFFSVSQHSVLVSELVEPEHAFAGLLHDAAEAFLGDVARPLKQRLPDYQAIEARVEAAVLAHFGLPYPMAPEVHRADRVALYIEQRDLLPAHHDDGHWEALLGFESNHPRIFPHSPAVAKAAFLKRYYELAGR